MVKLFKLLILLTITSKVNAQNSIKNYGNIQMHENAQIAFLGDFINEGSYTNNLGTLYFNGASSQQINTTSNSVIGLNNLVINNSSGVTLSSGAIDLTGTLTLTNGTFSTNDSLHLISNSLGTARIAEITGGDITGDITMQRYIDAGATNWRFICSAVSGTTIADLNDDFITSGFIGSDFPDWPSASDRWPSIYYYYEPHIGIQDSGFVPASNVTNALAVGQGIWTWSGDTITGTSPFTIDMKGPSNKGNINVPVSYTNTGSPNDDGWNMAGNPYPSTIDWDDLSITRTGINNAIYIWDPETEQFASYVGGIGNNGGSRYIASSQAFWIQATDATASLQMTEGSKSAIDQSFFKSANPLIIEVTNDYGKDQTTINIEPNSFNGFDAMYDAHKVHTVTSGVPSISSLIGGVEYSINQIPQTDVEIYLKVTASIAGLHNIEFKGLNNFSNLSCLIVEDLFTGNSYNLHDTNSFSVFISDTTTVARFLLGFGAENTLSVTDVNCFGNNDGAIFYDRKSNLPFQTLWKNNAGDTLIINSNVIRQDSLMNITSGTYTVETTNAVCGISIDTITINEPLQIIPQFTNDKDTVYLSNGATINFTNTSNNTSFYKWNFGDGNISNLISPSHQYFSIGNYQVNLSAYQDTSCFEQFDKNIVVLGTTTSIKDIAINGVKIWIDNNDLIIKGNNSLDKIEVRTILGELLFVSFNNSSAIFNLQKIPSQTLLINIINKNKISSTKRMYIKK